MTALKNGLNFFSDDPNHTHEVVTWRDIRDQAGLLNPDIAAILNQLKGVAELPVLLIRYPYGMEIAKRGRFQVNFNGTPYYWKDSTLPPKFKQLLHYYWHILPLGMVMEHASESTLESNNVVISNVTLTAGRTFSAWSVFEDVTNNHIVSDAYTLYSGCKNILSLPPLSDMQFGLRLAKTYGFKPIYPKNFTEQFNLFKALSSHMPNPQKWYCTLALFSSKIVDKIRHSAIARSQFLTGAWNYTAYMRNQSIYDYIFSDFIDKRLTSAIKNRVQVIESAKHILKILIGEAPGFSPCVSDEIAPISQFTKALVDDYRIRYHFPTIMSVSWYDGKRPIYYSLQHPTFLHSIPEKTTSKQTLVDMAQLVEIIRSFKEDVLKDKLAFSLKNTKLSERLENTDISFYHPFSKNNIDIQSDLDNLFNTDKRFKKMRDRFNTRELEFSKTSLFFNGLIKISPIKG